MTQFFKSKTSNSKYYVYLLISKLLENAENNTNKNGEKRENVENKYSMNVRIIISNMIIPFELSYILDNYEMIIKKDLEYKIINTLFFNYNFDIPIPNYPYNMFFHNRVLLHSFLYLFENMTMIKELYSKDKLNIIVNSNYLKRIKDWSSNWKKNGYSIEKFQQSDVSSESVFSIHSLSQCYFNISLIPKDEDVISKNIYYFKCTSMNNNDKSVFERVTERPNTDLIEKCVPYFENDKLIKIM